MIASDQAPVLVLGGNGLVGTAVCELLGGLGRDVVATFHGSEPRLHRAHLAWVSCDLRQRGALSLLPEASGIVHVAAKVPLSFPRSEAEAEHNRQIDTNVLDEYRRREIPLVFASIGAVYAGPPPEPAGWTEGAR